MTMVSLSEFKQLYVNKNSLKKYCLPEFFLDLASGWSQETVRQVYMTMTKKQAIPMKLWFDTAEEMRIISNKKQQLSELFNWLNFKGLNRIDTMQLFAVIVIAVADKPEVTLNSKFNQLSLLCQI